MAGGTQMALVTFLSSSDADISGYFKKVEHQNYLLSYDRYKKIWHLKTGTDSPWTLSLKKACMAFTSKLVLYHFSKLWRLCTIPSKLIQSPFFTLSQLSLSCAWRRRCRGLNVSEGARPDVVDFLFVVGLLVEVGTAATKGRGRDGKGRLAWKILRKVIKLLSG
jgi:hypothetical protein